MFSSIQNTLTISKILSGLSKSIGIIKEIPPLYNEIKPLIKKIPYLKDVLNLKKQDIPKENLGKIMDNNSVHNVITKSFNSNGPTFFQ